MPWRHLFVLMLLVLRSARSAPSGTLHQRQRQSRDRFSADLNVDLRVGIIFGRSVALQILKGREPHAADAGGNGDAELSGSTQYELTLADQATLDAVVHRCHIQVYTPRDGGGDGPRNCDPLALVILEGLRRRNFFVLDRLVLMFRMRRAAGVGTRGGRRGLNGEALIERNRLPRDLLQATPCEGVGKNERQHSSCSLYQATVLERPSSRSSWAPSNREQPRPDCSP